MKIRLAILLLALAFVVPGLALAAGQEEPVTYVIKKGDTLWGLSDRFIKDPRYWPNMWAGNSQITNPHLIYPGQMVRIFPDRIEIVPKEDTASPVPQKTVDTKTEAISEVAAERTYTVRGSEGFLVESDIKPAGFIIGAHHERIIMGDDDMVYTDIGKSQGVKGGEKYSIYRKEGSVSHPLTNEIMGAKVIPLGILQLTELEQASSRAIITRVYQEITPGSFLMPYRDERRHEVALKMPSRDLKGYIIESYSGAKIIATGDIVYIDLGTSQGTEVGNMLYIIRDVPVDQKLVEGRVDKLPQEVVGALVVLETGRKTSMAVVVKSIDAIYKDDRIISLIK